MTDWVWWYSTTRTNHLYKKASATTGGMISDTPQGTHQCKKFPMSLNLVILPNDSRRVSVYQAPLTEHFRIEDDPSATLPPPQ